MAAIRAAQLGMQVAIVEEDALGGVCLNWGCIPTKSILDAAEHYDAVKRGIPGLVVEGLSADWGAVIDASRKAARRLNAGVKSLMKKNKIEVLEGRGSLGGGRQVLVRNGDGERGVEGANVLLATGSSEFVFPGVEVDGKRVLTSREALEARNFPESIVIVGGGAVGVEFAYAYAAYGSRVTLVEMADQLLPGMEQEVAEALASSFRRRGIELATRTSYKALETSASEVIVGVESEAGERVPCAPSKSCSRSAARRRRKASGSRRTAWGSRAGSSRWARTIARAPLASGRSATALGHRCSRTKRPTRVWPRPSSWLGSARTA